MHSKTTQVLATLEILSDDEARRTIERSKKQVSKGEYIECSINDVGRVLK